MTDEQTNEKTMDTQNQEPFTNIDKGMDLDFGLGELNSSNTGFDMGLDLGLDF